MSLENPMNRRSFLEHVLASGVFAGALPAMAQTAAGITGGEQPGSNENVVF
jgi:hypothetical protein